MKRFKKILKWTGLVLLFLVVTLAIVVAARQNLKYDAPYPNVKATTDTAVINRGKHLVYSAAHCADCHGKGNVDSFLALNEDVPLVGGMEFKMPIGTMYTRNITPDRETGIGRYTDAEIARALRYGVRPDGTAMFDFMPFHNVSDEDLTAIISYLRSQKPVKHEVPDHTFNLMGRAVKAFLIKPVGPTGEVPVSVKKDTTAAYGQYLAVNVANCAGCHTNRDIMTGAFIGEHMAGGLEMEGLITPNLTPHPSSRIYKWSKQQFIERFRKGKFIQQSHMPWNSFKRMTDDELTAIYNYLQTVKPVATEVKK